MAKAVAPMSASRTPLMSVRRARPPLATLCGRLTSGRLADNADHDDGLVRGLIGPMPGPREVRATDNAHSAG